VSVSVSVRLKQRATTFNGGVVGHVNSSYSVIQKNCVQSESFGRVFFVDEAM
jgi:hypothetical protein